MNELDECSTRYGERLHFRQGSADRTLCGKRAIPKRLDRKHREDPFCHRCVKSSKVVS